MPETEALDVPLIQQESFGPVLSLETFTTDFTKDVDRAQRVVRRTPPT
jgi:hypothetical protein